MVLYLYLSCLFTVAEVLKLNNFKGKQCLFTFHASQGLPLVLLIHIRGMLMCTLSYRLRVKVLVRTSVTHLTVP